jgi:hypothetical protein
MASRGYGAQTPETEDAHMIRHRLMLGCLLTLVVLAVARAQTPEQLALLMKGRLEADLGRHAKAAQAFASLADDAGAPSALRAEALARLGLAQSAGGDRRTALATLATVLSRHANDAFAVRFATGIVASSIPGKVWPEFRTRLEDLLASATLTGSTDMGIGRPAPKRLRLQWDQFELRAAWRPSGVRSDGQPYSPELAAYELDRLLDLDMVPPTVARAADGQPGSVQYWVNGIRVLRSMQEAPATEEWARQIDRMKFFDSLLGNTGRVLSNMLIDPDDRLLLIDHIYSFSTERTLANPPARFDRKLVEKLKALDRPEAQQALRRMLGDAEREALLARRDLLLAHLARLVALRGEAVALFGDSSKPASE